MWMVREYKLTLILYRTLSGISSGWCQTQVNVEVIQRSANTNQPWNSRRNKAVLCQNERPGREKQDRVTLNL